MESQSKVSLDQYRRFGVRLHVWRTMRELSARELVAEVVCHGAKISDAYLIQIEKGRRPIPTRFSQPIAILTNILKDTPSPHELVLWLFSSQYDRVLRDLALEGLRVLFPKSPSSLVAFTPDWTAVWNDLIPVLFGGQVVEDRVIWDEVTAGESVRRAEIADVIDWLTTTTTDLHLQFDAPAQAESPEPAPLMTAITHLRLGGMAQVSLSAPDES